MRPVILVVVILATTSAGLRQSARAVHSPPEGVGSVHGEDTVRNEVWWKENLLTKASNGTPTLPPIDNTRHHFGTVNFTDINYILLGKTKYQQNQESFSLGVPVTWLATNPYNGWV
ncbi:hypothetical protein ONE63_003346 [Megalurothrips usitatus]|uniref:Uncharacterized protein n=1 Tax=Megalurothrips usitatus TaxID=439358 RepID=A0AAV7X9Z0_9NEOP|nr:hypothetical protein ONE63_003346 [Megalurothrips usitatus]